MGIFTWTLANNREQKLKYDGPGAILCPDDTKIVEHCYDGYGVFDGQDVYDLVVDWNRPYLSEIIKKIEEKEGPNFWGSSLIPIMHALQDGDDDALKESIDEVAKTQPYLRQDWKRNIGIAIACEHNDIIPYPIKIVNVRCKAHYDELPPSVSTQ